MSDNIVLFWSRPIQPGETFKEWINSDINLLEFHDMSLASHQRLGHNVELYTYQTILTEVPDCVIIKDAHEFFDRREAYRALKDGHSIAHISDLVRLSSALEKNGVVLDLDTVMLNPFPDYDCFTSSLPAKKTGSMAIKFGKTQPRFEVSDWDGEALSNFPIKVHTSIQTDIEVLIGKIKHSLLNEPKTGSKGWNFIMHTIRDIANKNEHMYVMKPIECGVIPAWKSKGNCYSLDSPTKFDGESELFGYRLPSIEEIFDSAYCVQHFFDSAFKGANTSGGDFWSTIKKGSLLDHEALLIFGPDWRHTKSDLNTLDI